MAQINWEKALSKLTKIRYGDILTILVVDFENGKVDCQNIV